MRFGERTHAGQEESPIGVGRSSQGRGRVETPRDVDLNAVEYIPLPPSPHTWDLDGRDVLYREYKDPDLKEIFRAGSRRKHTKVIDLAKRLSVQQLAGHVGEVVAKAYRDTVHKRLRANQITPAARWAREMLDTVPVHCTDVDKRRYSKILGMLDKARVKHTFDPIDASPTNDQPLFAVSEGSEWTLAEIKVLRDVERPDPAFHQVAFMLDGVLYADTQGKSGLAAGGRGALRKFDRSGNVVAERSISHDIHRLGCGPTSRFCAIMDTGGVLHVYNESLSVVVERDLRSDRRVEEHFKTTDTHYRGGFRSQVRAVDINADGQLYLFTLADEAWCCSASGDTVWGVRMPLNEGWVRAVGRRNAGSGPSAEVAAALTRLGLALPVTPDQVKRQFRVLALQHHPDRNPRDSGAHERMQEINEAFQILTGLDPAMIDIEAEEADLTFFRRESADHVFEAGPIRVEIWGSSGPAQDWIYGASFSGHGSGAFLATYSGKVVEVDGAGVPLRAYDVGAVPKEIVDTGDYLCFLTSTCLYVLEGRNRLVALVDVFRQGRLIIGMAGFGLLDSKCLQWFSPSGVKLGDIISRDPIRTLYHSDEGAVLQTRQHSTLVKGLRLCQVHP